MTKQERSWVLYDCANSAYTLVITTAVLPIFFKTFAAQGVADADSTAYWGYGNTIASLFVAVLAPVLGALADHKGNKKRMFAGFLLVGIFATAALTLVGPGDWKLCLLIYGVSYIGFYGSVIFYDSFIVDVTSKERMDWISSSGFAWGYVASTIPYIAIILLIQFNEAAGISKVTATRMGFLIAAAWWFTLSIPMLRNVKQIHFVPPSDHPIRESFGRLAQTIRDISQYKTLFLFLLAFFCYIDGVHTIYKMASAFGLDVGVEQGELMLILLVTQLVAFPFALLYGRLAKTFGVKRMLLAGVTTYIFVTVFAYFMTTSLHFWILGFLIATAQGGIQSLSRSYYAKLIPPEKSAQFFGFYDIFGKFAAIVGPTLVAVFAQLTGESRTGVLSLIVLFVAGGALLLRLPETDPRHQNE